MNGGPQCEERRASLRCGPHRRVGQPSERQGDAEDPRRDASHVSLLRFCPWDEAGGSHVTRRREKILGGKQKAPRLTAGLFEPKIIMKRCVVLGRPGSDLLFQALRLSTISAGEFNGRVRDGFGFSLSANTTRLAKDDEADTGLRLNAHHAHRFGCDGHWK